MRSRSALHVAICSVIGAAVLTAAPYGARALASGAAQAGSGGQEISGGTYGVPQAYPGFGNGDTAFNTWAADGNVYATSDDTTGFSGRCNSNVAVNELAGGDPSTLTSPYTNCMTSYGSAGSPGNYNDGATWKTDGVISVDGTLYVVTARQVDGYGGYPAGYQASTDASIVKSADNGRTWSNGFGTSGDPNGAAPPPSPSGHGAEAMFPGQSFSTPVFVNYGQDDNPADTADGGDQYVYAISTNGWAYDGSYDILGRVPRSKIGDLNAADWQFYTGPAGGDGTDSANWSGNVAQATHVLAAKDQLSEGGVQYLPDQHEYILTTGHYPFNAQWPNDGVTAHSTWAVYRAPHPWGPWTRILSEPTTTCYFTCTQTSTSPMGLYTPVPVSKFVAMGGLSDVVFGSGDYMSPNRPNDYLYRIHAFPLTLSTTSQHVADDTVMPCTYTGNWGVSYQQGGYYGSTNHSSASPGATATCTFYGNSIAWAGGTNSNHGDASVSVDGGAASTVDTYSAQWAKQHVLFEKDGLSDGRHTITITVTSQHDAASTGTYQDVDAFIVGH